MLPHKRQSAKYCYNFEPQTWCQNRCKRCFRLKEHHSFERSFSVQASSVTSHRGSMDSVLSTRDSGNQRFGSIGSSVHSVYRTPYEKRCRLSRESHLMDEAERESLTETAANVSIYPSTDDAAALTRKDSLPIGSYRSAPALNLDQGDSILEGNG
ncbi:hypothetical protein D918_06610 [Trichuris suis]|nr:hypothetical protein D918_06610 [Trichuris suis]